MTKVAGEMLRADAGLLHKFKDLSQHKHIITKLGMAAQKSGTGRSLGLTGYYLGPVSQK